MQELLQESIRLVNFPLTVCLAVVVIYWLLVTVGALDGDSASGDGLHLDHGTAGGDFTVHHSDADGDFHAAGSELSGWGFFLQLIGAADAPVMIFASVLVLSMWVFSILYNHFWTGGSVPFALSMLVPNFIASALLTRGLLLPLRPIFRLLNRDPDETQPLIGRTCQIATSRADATFGQAIVETKGAPLLIHVRTTDGSALPKGATALLVRRDAEKGIYFVVGVTAEKLA